MSDLGYVQAVHRQLEHLNDRMDRMEKLLQEVHQQTSPNLWRYAVALTSAVEKQGYRIESRQEESGKMVVRLIKKEERL